MSMTAETIHTCSYACERPECIRAQRDELASRVTAPPPAAARGDVQYDRELIAQMLDVCGHPKYTLDAYREQARLLRDADNADAAGVHTAALAAEGVQAGEVVAWMTPGGDVSRSFYWCLERCLPGQEPRPLYTAPPSAPVGVPVDVVREYLDARACYEEATRRPNSHAPAPVLKHGDPVVLRLRDARVALDNAITLAQQPAAVDGAGKVPVSESALRYCIRELNGARRGDNAEGRAELVHHVLTAWLDLATQHQEPTT